MPVSIPHNPKIFHIVHIDRLASIISEEFLWSDAVVQQLKITGAKIGMDKIKSRRLQTTLTSFPKLHIGECVPFYFCPRSVMLYLLHKKNHSEITYRDGQAPIIHLQADLHKTVKWADENDKRWVFTDSNAGSYYFNDYADLSKLNQVDWSAVLARSWQRCREKKQAEFLLEERFPWTLVECIGVYSPNQQQQVSQILLSADISFRPSVLIKRDWYY